jgi:hypothetical protein
VRRKGQQEIATPPAFSTVKFQYRIRNNPCGWVRTGDDAKAACLRTAKRIPLTWTSAARFEYKRDAQASSKRRIPSGDRLHRVQSLPDKVDVLCPPGTRPFRGPFFCALRERSPPTAAGVGPFRLQNLSARKVNSRGRGGGGKPCTSGEKVPKLPRGCRKRSQNSQRFVPGTARRAAVGDRSQY